MQDMPPKLSIIKEREIKLAVGMEMERLQKRTNRGKAKPIDNIEEILQQNMVSQDDKNKYKKTDKQVAMLVDTIKRVFFVMKKPTKHVNANTLK